MTKKLQITEQTDTRIILAVEHAAKYWKSMSGLISTKTAASSPTFPVTASTAPARNLAGTTSTRTHRKTEPKAEDRHNMEDRHNI